MLGRHLTELLDEPQHHSHPDVFGPGDPIPRSPGVYAWYFLEVPPGVPGQDCVRHSGLTLLYTGISPKRPPANGRPPSSQHLRQRIRYHYQGNAEGSTLP